MSDTEEMSWPDPDAPTDLMGTRTLPVLVDDPFGIKFKRELAWELRDPEQHRAMRQRLGDLIPEMSDKFREFRMPIQVLIYPHESDNPYRFDLAALAPEDSEAVEYDEVIRQLKQTDDAAEASRLIRKMLNMHDAFGENLLPVRMKLRAQFNDLFDDVLPEKDIASAVIHLRLSADDKKESVTWELIFS